jgi:hypothetical protein
MQRRLSGNARWWGGKRRNGSETRGMAMAEAGGSEETGTTRSEEAGEVEEAVDVVVVIFDL